MSNYDLLKAAFASVGQTHADRIKADYIGQSGYLCDSASFDGDHKANFAAWVKRKANYLDTLKVQSDTTDETGKRRIVFGKKYVGKMAEYKGITVAFHIYAA